MSSRRVMVFVMVALLLVCHVTADCDRDWNACLAECHPPGQSPNYPGVLECEAACHSELGRCLLRIKPMDGN